MQAEVKVERPGPMKQQHGTYLPNQLEKWSMAASKTCAGFEFEAISRAAGSSNDVDIHNTDSLPLEYQPT